MCGRFTQMASWRELVAFSQALTTDPGAESLYATPMRDAFVIHLDARGARVTTPMRWGFAAQGATSPGRPKHMHARAETIDTLPTFADAFANRRGIIVVADFNVGEELPNGKTKQWRITPKDWRPLTFAVVFEHWTNGEQSLWTFVQTTTPASSSIAPITDRMPAILQPDDWAVCLGEQPGDAKALLRTFEDRGAWDIRPQAKPGQPMQADLF